MTQIKLPKGAKPSKAVSADVKRPKLCRAYVAEPNGHRELIATDSYIIARLPVDDDVPLGPVPAEALKRIERGETHDVTDAGVKFTTKDETAVVYPSNGDTELPNFAGKNPPEFDPGKCDVIEVAFNPKLLAALSEALGAGNNGVKLEVPILDGKAAPRGIRVTPINAAKADPRPHGLLMPIRLTV